MSKQELIDLHLLLTKYFDNLNKNIASEKDPGYIRTFKNTVDIASTEYILKIVETDLDKLDKNCEQKE